MGGVRWRPRRADALEQQLESDMVKDVWNMFIATKANNLASWSGYWKGHLAKQ